ncbi:MAG: hypothetical protein JRI47_03985 [Deltaproteobacteria bacterium]|nr:hypothetical protein [Deltaproteobacteria bacterium]
MKIRRLLIKVLATVVFVSLATTSAWAGSKRRSSHDSVAINIGVTYVDNAPHKVNYYPVPRPRVAYCTAPAFYFSAGIAHRFPRFYYSSPRVYFGGPPHRGYGHWKRHYPRGHRYR